MIDVKKLIIGFLILAIGATCFGTAFTLANTSSPTQASASASGITIAGGQNSNAFLSTQDQVNQVIAEYSSGLASSSMEVSSTDPTNLTDDLAAEFVNGVVVANPTGPTSTDADGNPVLNPPDVNALAMDIAESTSTANLNIPDWNVEAESVPINVVATTNPAALEAYSNAVNSILNDHIQNDAQLQSIVNDQSGDTTPADLNYAETQTQNALQDIASLKVPAPEEDFQKSLIAQLVYEKDMTQLNILSQTDPVKASIIFEQEDQNFPAVEYALLKSSHDFAVAEGSISLQQPPPDLQKMVLSFLGGTFGLSEAHAQIVPIVDDPILDFETQADDSAIDAMEAANATEATVNVTSQQESSASLMALISSIHLQNEGDKIEAIVKNTLLQILKNTLTSIIQREVLTWIQGSGAPKFITNWGTQLVNAAQMTAINAINQQMTCGVFPPFVPQLKVTLNAFYKPGNNSCANQFAAALGGNSFQQFYNNFKNGGFVAFGASTLPSGNPYGSLFFNAQTVQLAYSNQQAATKLQTQTSQGLRSGLVCDDGSDPVNGQHLVCEGPNQDFTSTSGSCPTGYTPDMYDNNGLCADGSQPQVTTPAAATGFVLGSGIDATPKQLAAANDITGILNSVLNSLLTSLASTAVNAAGQLVNQGLTSINGSTITAAASSTPPAAMPLACNPSSQIIPPPQTISTVSLNSTSSGSQSGTYTAPPNSSPSTVSASGGTFDANGNLPTYFWSDSQGVTSTGGIFSDTFSASGTYTITLNDSASDTPAICTVIVQ
jgi:hypothetical protein